MSRKATELASFFFALIIVIVFVAVLPANAVEMQTTTSQQTNLFIDLTNDDAVLPYINFLAGKSIIKGFDDGTFRPGEGLTRAQAAALMVRASGITVNPSTSDPFNDIQADYWARDSINAAVEAGYINGFPDRSFRPEEQLTRAQAATMVLRLSKQKLSIASDPQINDVNSSHWAASSIAEVVAAGMIKINSDDRQFYPDQAITRKDMARVLGVLLTEDPDFYKADLIGTITVKNGTVSLQKNQQEPVNITGTSKVVSGDTIITGNKSEARISFEDGSGFLIKENTRVTIVEAYGRTYIKQDGNPAVAVDWLNLNLQQGTLFGALPGNQSDEEQSSPGTMKTGYLAPFKTTYLASLNGFQLLGDAAGTQTDSPWYNTSKQKKVKVKVDMPWGVAAVRGTQFCVWSNPNGKSGVSVLNGIVSFTSGGQTVEVATGQMTQGTDPNSPPPPPGLMDQSQLKNWNAVRDWVLEQAAQMQQNGELDQTEYENIVNIVNGAIQDVQERIIQPGGSGGSSGGGGSSDTTAPTMTSLIASVDDEAIEPVEGVLTVALGSVTSSIRVGMSEPVTLSGTPVVMMTLPYGDFEYGTITLDPQDSTNKTLIITPHEANGTAGLVGTFTFTVAAGSVMDAAGNGIAETTFTLHVAVRLDPFENVDWDDIISWPTIVNCSGYKIMLYKNGVIAGEGGTIFIEDPDTDQYDVSDAIYAAGAGVYTAAIQAIGDGIDYLDGPVYELPDRVYRTTGVELSETEDGVTTVISGADLSGTIYVSVTDGNENWWRTAVEVAANDDQAAVAGKIRDALRALESLAEYFTVSGEEDSIRLTEREPGSDIYLQVYLNATFIRSIDDEVIMDISRYQGANWGTIWLNFYNYDNENTPTVAELLNAIESSDGSRQTYKIIRNDAVLNAEDHIQQYDSLVVTAEDGLTQAKYMIAVGGY
jgi:hypothetical protein